ncbi:MAG TPA: hypothetical protein VGQ41_05390 [Pyrinomonadaceae bacterium]|jgi:uncharacterized membrane-anchored protein YhcB (DUF1043 family)|nr:hypothetical protein [Pyrinomonadaceae bacterium]
MDKIKIIFVIIAVILGSLGLFVAIGFIYSLLFYGLILAVVCLGGYVAFRLFAKPETKQLQTPDPQKQIEKVQRLLDEYKRK